MAEKRLKNIIIINDDFGTNGGGGSKVSTMEAIEFSKNYNVFYFCGFTNEPVKPSNNLHVINLFEQPFLKFKNKIKGAMLGIYCRKARKRMSELLSSFSAKDTVIHIHGFPTALSSSIFKPIYESKIPVFYTCHAYFLVCKNGGFFDYRRNKVCSLNPFGIKCSLRNCDSRNYLFHIYRNMRQVVQNKAFFKNHKSIHYIFLSELSKSVMEPYLGKDIDSRIIHNPIDNREAEIPDHTKYDSYLFVGRVDKEKGIDILCEHAKKKDIKLTIVGSGSLIDELMSKYASENIVFAGWKKFDEICIYMQQSRALIFPSVWYECEPLTILEAKGYGLPIICSSICAGKENISEQSGIIYDPYNYEEFSKAIDFMNDDAKLSNLAFNSHREYEKYVEQNNNYLELIDYYEEVLLSSK